jgi:hypothetical protein
MITHRLLAALMILLLGVQQGNFPPVATVTGTANQIGVTAGANPVISILSTYVDPNHPTIQFCGTTSSCSHTAQTAAQVVWGSAPLVSGTPSTVTITGISPAFTSASSYTCALTDDTTATNNLLKVANVSGSSFTVTGPATTTDVVGFVCVGT